MSNFRRIHSLFLLYWKIVEQRGVGLGNWEVFATTSHVFGVLQTEWEMNNWDVEELKSLVSAMDHMPNDINPNLFLGSYSAYLDQLTNYYIENKNVWICYRFTVGSLFVWSQYS